MARVFLCWDNSNILTGAQDPAAEREGWGARSRVRIHFPIMIQLACRQRPIGRALAVGPVPPQLRGVRNRLEAEGIEVQLFERGGQEQGVDQALQTAILRDALDNNGNPGIAVLLNGDGAGFDDGCGFHAGLERMHRKGWEIEVLSWRHSCNNRMRRWAEEKGRFIALDDFYPSVRGLLTIVPTPQASNTKKCLRIQELLDKLLHFVYIYLVNSILKPCHQARHNARASPSWSY